MADTSKSEFSKRRALAAAIFTILSWAAAFPLIRLALQEIPPIPLAAMRFALAGLLAIGWLLARGRTIPANGDLVRVAAAGLMGFAFYNVFLNMGQRTVSAGTASFIVNTAPMMTSVLAMLFAHERFTARAWFGSFIALAGVALLSVGQPGGLNLGSGASLVFAAAASQAAYFLLQRPLVLKYGATDATAYSLLAGALWLLLWLPEGAERLADASVQVIASVLALAILPAWFGYLTWSYALGFFGAARAANFLYMVPPTALALAYLLIGELPGLNGLLGGALAILGVWTVNSGRPVGRK